MSSGKSLDVVLEHLGMTRMPGETDYALRMRFKAKMRGFTHNVTLQKLLFVLLKLRVVSSKHKQYMPVGLDYDNISSWSTSHSQT